MEIVISTSRKEVIPATFPGMRYQIATKGKGGISMNDFNIVVIDDDEAVLALILKIAKERGLEVQVFANCQDAAEWLIANSQNVKIAVADNEMPGIAGSALLAQAKILNPGIVTVLMSLYARDTLPPGVDKFYEKSNSAAEGLLKFLQDILQG